MTEQFSIYKSIYKAIDNYLSEHPEHEEELEPWLSEANPEIWGDEGSGNPAVYEDFKAFLAKIDYSSLPTFQIAKLYFAQLDDFYVGTIKIVAGLDEKEFNSLLAKSSN